MCHCNWHHLQVRIWLTCRHLTRAKAVYTGWTDFQLSWGQLLFADNHSADSHDALGSDWHWLLTHPTTSACSSLTSAFAVQRLLHSSDNQATATATWHIICGHCGRVQMMQPNILKHKINHQAFALAGVGLSSLVGNQSLSSAVTCTQQALRTMPAPQKRHITHGTQFLLPLRQLPEASWMPVKEFSFADNIHYTVIRSACSCLMRPLIPPIISPPKPKLIPPLVFCLVPSLIPPLEPPSVDSYRRICQQKHAQQ